MQNIVHLVTLTLLVIFLISYYQDRRKILNGFIFNNFILSFLVSLMLLAFQSNNHILIVMTETFLVLLFVIFSIGVVAIAIAAILNARILIKKEGKRLSNYLSLFFGLSVLLAIYISRIDVDENAPVFISMSVNFLNFIILYFSLTFTSFMMSAFIYSFYKPKKDLNYIIVLGCGLIDGKDVSYLLASRVDKAIKIYTEQAKKATPPILIFSGGQGADELISEAQAMYNYAISKGVAHEHTLLEDKSINTYQNMQFSKNLIDSMSSPEQKNTLFVTNNFHVLRSAIFAKKVSLNAQGIGAHTAYYYWPNAILREFIGALYIFRKGHIILISLALSFYILFEIIYFFITSK